MTDPAGKNRPLAMILPPGAAQPPRVRIALAGTRSTPKGFPPEAFGSEKARDPEKSRLPEAIPERECHACPDQRVSPETKYRLVLRCTSVREDH